MAAVVVVVNRRSGDGKGWLGGDGRRGWIGLDGWRVRVAVDGRAQFVGGRWRLRHGRSVGHTGLSGESC